MGTKFEMIILIIWLAAAIVYPLPSPTDGDGSVTTFPHKAEFLAALHSITHHSH